MLDTDATAAVAPLQKAVELTPNQASPKFLLGMALERTHKLPEAIEQYQAAESLDGADFNIRFSLARALLNAGRPAEAEPEFRATVRRMRPDAPGAQLGLARSLVAEQHFDEGALQLEKYLAMQPNDVNGPRGARRCVWICKSTRTRWPTSIKPPRPARKASARSNCGRRSILKRSVIAMPSLSCKKAEVLDPRSPDIPARLGHVYLENKDYPNAARELIVAFKMESDSDDVLKDLVLAQYLNKNYPAALEGIESFIQTGIPATGKLVHARHLLRQAAAALKRARCLSKVSAAEYGSKQRHVL